MPSGTAVPPKPSPEISVALPPTECETVIQKRLQKTQRHVKGTDIAGGLIILAIGVLAYLLVTSAMDHWLVVGGLGFWGRFWLSLLFWGAAAVYVVYRLLPPLFGRINPVFAAATIEQSQPSLKNSLVNFLLLRGRPREVAAPIYRAMEHRAAADLSNVEVDAAVDRTHIIRLGCVLAGVLAIFSLYLIVSPKNPIRSAARVLWPWASVEAPTRVTIRDILPGNTVAFHGNHVTVSAEIAGLRTDESALLVYRTADGQTVDQTIPMTRPDGDYRYQCQLPPGKLGLQQDYEYYLAAGDCRTRRYQVQVQVAPTIVVDKVVYRYPDYTGLADQTVVRQGDLRAIEGTEATLYATANGPIKLGTAEIDLGCTGRRGLRMSVDDREAVGRLTLKLDPKDPSQPKYDSYQLRFADAQGRENQRPIRHHIDVIRDLPPEVQLVEPRQEEVRVAVNGELSIRVRAKDPDFGLRRVTLRAERDGRGLPIAPLLERRKPEKARPGVFSGAYTFVPAQLGLKAGDRVEYWVEAQDNKEPTPGRTASGRQWILVVESDARDQASDGRANEDTNDRPDDQNDAHAGDNGENATGDRDNRETPNDDQSESRDDVGGGAEQPDAADRREPSDDERDDGQSSDEQRPSDERAQASEKPDERIDPDTAPGDAMQEILNDRQRQQEQSAEDQSPSDDQKSEERSSDQRQQEAGDQSQTGDQQAGGKQSDQPSDGDKSDEAKPGGQKGSGEKSPEENRGGEKGPDQESGETQSGAEKGESGKSGDKQSSGERGVGESPGQEDAAGEQPGETDADRQGGEADDEKTAAEQDGAGQSGSEESTDQGADGQQGTQGSSSDKQRGTETSNGEKSGANTTNDTQQTSSSADERSSAQETSGSRRPDEQSSPGPGENVGDNEGSPAPQKENQPRRKQQDNVGETSDQRDGQSAQSPSISKKESDSQGDTAGDRSGGGQKGGGQQADQPGVGGSGTHTAANEGTSASDQQGTGQTGDDAGQQAASKTPTGSAAKRKSAEGDQRTTTADERGDEAAGGDRAGDASQKPGQQPAAEKSADQNTADERGTPQQEPTDGGIPGKGSSEGPTARGSGPPTAGGAPGTTSDAEESAEPADSRADQANLEYARRQTALALEHLRDQLAKEKPELLEQLGWSKDDARQFLERWEQMRRSAAQPGAAGQRAGQHFDNALRSLGLRPGGAELHGGGVAPEDSAGLRDAGRFAPPADWAEQFRAYTRGIAGDDQQR